MLGGKRFGHAINKLIIRRCELDRERALKNTFPDKVVVDFHMFGSGMKKGLAAKYVALLLSQRMRGD